MTLLLTTLINAFVKPFYRENAGVFLFFMTVMFLCVGPLNGAGVVEYHYSLIRATLQSTQLFVIVCVAWLLYTRKCMAFVSAKLNDARYSFLHVYNSLVVSKRLILLFVMQTILFLPVLIYGSFIVAVALAQHSNARAFVCSAYLLVLCIAPAIWYIYDLRHIQKDRLLHLPGTSLAQRILALASRYYPLVLLRYIVTKQKAVFAGIKVFTCGMLYAMALSNTTGDYDIQFTFLIFNFGIVANGIIIYRTRNFEESALGFYRGLPVSMAKRWMGYLLVYAVFLVPEWIVIAALTPVHLHIGDARNFALCSFSIILLFNSVSFLDDFSMKGYLRVLLVILCIEYFFVIADALTFLYLTFFIVATTIFVCSYYQFENAKGRA